MFYRIVRAIFNFVKPLFRMKTKNKKALMMNDGFIICSNHIHASDVFPIAMISTRQVHFMAKDELFRNKILAKIITMLGSFKINREGNDITAIKTALNILKRKKVLCIFPEGTITGSENIYAFKPGVVMIALKTQTAILPVYIKPATSVWHRRRMIIGEELDLQEYYGKNISLKELNNISKILRDEVLNLKDKLEQIENVKNLRHAEDKHGQRYIL